MFSVFTTPFAVAAVFAGLAAAQNSSSADPTVNLFINDAYGGQLDFAASIVTACADQTVYALQCTSGPASIDSDVCGSNGVIVTMTEGPSTYAFDITTTAVIADQTAAVEGSENCALSDTTAADCTAVVSGSIDGTSTQTTITSLITGAAYHRYDVAITGGAEKTASATATCAVQNGAMPRNAGQGMTLGCILAAGIVGMLVF